MEGVIIIKHVLRNYISYKEDPIDHNEGKFGESSEGIKVSLSLHV
jgi:hypothetical protein